MVIQSPCIRTCQLLNNICTGCFRSREEIKHWNETTNEERKRIMRNVDKRKTYSHNKIVEDKNDTD